MAIINHDGTETIYGVEDSTQIGFQVRGDDSVSWTLYGKLGGGDWATIETGTINDPPQTFNIEKYSQLKVGTATQTEATIYLKYMR